MLQLRDDECVLCSAHQACYHQRNLQPSFFFSLFFLEQGGEEGEGVLGIISEGVQHASNKDGFYIVHYNQADIITKGLIWRQKWQAELCLFGSPLFLIKWFYSVRVLPLILLLIHEKNFAVALYSLQINFSSSESIDGRWLVFPCSGKGNILRVGFLIFAETRCTEGLIGWGQLFVQEVSVAVAHDGGLTIGQLFLASSFIDRHESGEFGLALLPLWRSADGHPAGVWVAVFIALASTLPSQGYIWKRSWVCWLMERP